MSLKSICGYILTRRKVQYWKQSKNCQNFQCLRGQLDYSLHNEINPSLISDRDCGAAVREGTSLKQHKCD